MSNGTGGLSVSRLADALDDLNGHFANASLLFYVAAPVDYIDNDDFYLNIDTEAEIDALRGINTVAGAVNVYFTEELYIDEDALCGISSFSFSASQGIVMSNSCTATPTNHSTFSHEVGHYFDLFHTHETALGEECVDGSNCDSSGDGLCDTPADPNLSSVVDESCDYTGTATDSCNDDPYSPDTTLLMSYSTKVCRTNFTSGQSQKSLATLINLRSGHTVGTAPCGAITYVDGSALPGGDGSWESPYTTVDEGIQNAPCDLGFVCIKGGTYASAVVSWNSPVQLVGAGLVRIE